MLLAVASWCTGYCAWISQYWCWASLLCILWASAFVLPAKSQYSANGVDLRKNAWAGRFALFICDYLPGTRNESTVLLMDYHVRYLSLGFAGLAVYLARALENASSHFGLLVLALFILEDRDVPRRP
jgi:hypothetical protein